ncbi:TetR/AcrR family transcriptional regulator [Kitasatospora sp. NPDC049285]|uniref:TetR/AcrR family transcriptional regulator n=1 Tax=Kitasatospora sp. NPDC049285 TaxID=3157096 RepID=UPI003421F9A3
MRRALIGAGMAVAREGGPEAVVLRAVSRQVGVSHNAAYRHFRDREDLLAAVSAGCMNRLGELMIRRSGAVDLTDPVDAAWARLNAIGRAYVDFALTEHGWFRTAFSGAVAHGAEGEVDTTGEDPYSLLAQCLDELVEVGGMPPARRAGAQYAAWSAVHGLAALMVDGPLRILPADEREVAIAAVLNTVARGL